MTLSDGTPNNTINLSIGTGTVNITGSVSESGGANITFNVVPKLIVTFPVTESNALTFTLALVERVRLLLTVVAEEMDAMPAVLSTVRL